MLHLDKLLQTHLVYDKTSFDPMLRSLDVFNSCLQIDMYCNSLKHLPSRKPKKRTLSVSRWTPDGLRFFLTVTLSDEFSQNNAQIKSLATTETGSSIRKPSLRRGVSLLPSNQKKISRWRSLSVRAHDMAEYSEDYLIWESFQFVGDSLDIPMWLANKDGEPYWWSEKWIATFGSSWHKVIHPDDYSRSMTQRARFLILQKPYEIMHRLYFTAKQQHRWYKTRCCPVMHPRITGKCLRWVGTLVVSLWHTTRPDPAQDSLRMSMINSLLLKRLNLPENN